MSIENTNRSSNLQFQEVPPPSQPKKDNDCEVDIFTKLDQLQFDYTTTAYDDLFQKGFARLEIETVQKTKHLVFARYDSYVDKYSDILPYEHTVVKTPYGRLSGNYMPDGSIAMSAVKKSSVYPIADLIGRDQIPVIVRLTPHSDNGSEKSYNWVLDEDINDPNYTQTIEREILKTYPPIELDKEASNCPKLLVTKMRLELSCYPPMPVKEIYFEGWEDGEGTSVKAIIETIKIVRSTVQKTYAYLEKEGYYVDADPEDLEERIPFIVHCSAGVGRTGTFLAIKKIMEDLEAGKEPNIVQNILDLRYARHPRMVDTWNQFKLCYAAKQEYEKELRNLKNNNNASSEATSEEVVVDV